MTIAVVGGVYRERCVHPHWNRIYGSAGRAALAIGHMGTPVALHSYMDQLACDAIAEEASWLGDFKLQAIDAPVTVGFRYMHDLDSPQVEDMPSAALAPIVVSAEKILRFDMLECDARVHAEWAVYDPQGARSLQSFVANGSSAERLALVLNSWEASTLAGMPNASPAEIAPVLAQQQDAEVVVVKMGPQGAYVWSADAGSFVSAFRTPHVWKIGSGDCFAAHFANAWMHEGKTPLEAAKDASRAVAYFCQYRAFPTKHLLGSYAPAAAEVSAECLAGQRREVYLAGPFFDLAQLWLIEEARHALSEMGLQVFSPYHDVGLGSADDVVGKDLAGIRNAHIVFAVADGLDAGTLYEIGYARALGKPVIVYSEQRGGENMKMMEGSGCVMCGNFATAVYSAAWEAIRL